MVGQPVAYLNDPHVWVDSRAIVSIRFAIYESLVKYDRNARNRPGLASSWQLADDARTWTFHIRPGVPFHDGSILTANDAAASLRRAVSPDMPGEYGTSALLSLYLEHAEITALDDLTLQIVTPEPLADLLDLLLYAVIVPAKTIHQVNKNVPGTGPYRVSLEKENEVFLERFMEYWGGPAPIEKLIFRAIDTPQQRIQAFKNGEVDLITYMPVDSKQSLEGDEQAVQIERDTAFCVIIMFNAQKGACMDPRIRQALNYAADVDEIMQEVAHGKAYRMNGPLSPFHTAADPDLQPYPHDLEMAVRLLKEAGYAEGITLTMHRPTSSPTESAELAAILIRQWKKAGITIDEKVFENRQDYALMVRGKDIGDMGIFDSSPLSSYRVLREKLHSGFAGPWWQGYSNPMVNQLMEKAWATPDEAQRTSLYRQAYRIIHEDAPWLFLYCPKDLWVVRSSLKEALPDWAPGLSGLVEFGG